MSGVPQRPDRGQRWASYKAAGFKPSRQNARALLPQRQNISVRLVELPAQVVQIEAAAVAKAVKDHAITVDSLIVEAAALKKAAVENKQISAAVSALTVKAKLAGLWIERAEQRTPDLATRCAPSSIALRRRLMSSG